MKVARIRFIYDIKFEEIKSKFNTFTETQIAPNQYIYTDDSYFFTIITSDVKTILIVEDKNLSFPDNGLYIDDIPFNKITSAIIPDNIIVDFSYESNLKFNNWEKKNNYLQRETFKLYKKLKNNIQFLSINSEYIFLDYSEFIQELSKAVS